MSEYKWGSIVPLIGGMTLGAAKATNSAPDFMLSYKPFATNDQNIRAYYPDTEFQLLDEDKPKPEYQGADFITALCPCAGLSAASGGATPEKRASNNSWLYKTATTVLNELKPKVFFGENAPAFFTNRGKLVREDLAAIGKAAGYSFSCYFTNTMYHGVPQNRKRTFYFFWQGQDAPILNSYRTERQSFEQYLAEVQNTELELKQAKDAFNKDIEIQYLQAHGGTQAMKDWMKTQKNPNKASVLSYLQGVNELEAFTVWAFENGTERQGESALRRQHKLDTNASIFNMSKHMFTELFPTVYWRTQFSIHPTEDRLLTVRETMHLMAMPADFQLVTPKATNAICQSVPVCTAADMTKEVLGVLKGERSSSNKDFFMQSNVL